MLIADDSAKALGTPFLICDEVAGETIPRKIHRALDDSARERLLTQCEQALAAIHRADTARMELPDRDQLAMWRGHLDTIGTTTATFEWAFRWLQANRPPPSPPRLVHGDFSDEARLAAAIRQGQLDDRGAEVTGALRRLVADRLAVNHPGYATSPNQD